MVCVLHFSRTFLGKKHIFKRCALKKCNDFRQLKRSNFRVEKCKTEENLSKFLNNMTCKTVTYMKDGVMKRNKSYVKSCKKTLLLKKLTLFSQKNPLFSQKNPLFSQKTHCFPTCALFYPIVLKRKIITDYTHNEHVASIYIFVQSCWESHYNNYYHYFKSQTILSQ